MTTVVLIPKSVWYISSINQPVGSSDKMYMYIHVLSAWQHLWWKVMNCQAPSQNVWNIHLVPALTSIHVRITEYSPGEDIAKNEYMQYRHTHGMDWLKQIRDITNYLHFLSLGHIDQLLFVINQQTIKEDIVSISDELLGSLFKPRRQVNACSVTW